ncbi:MAG: BamA/TamA family outer membrane protein, partial [Acidobacteria bacterium]|nr:BamA/TamA family outer membrane protein [Acidobacteriota bacterium]
IERLYATGRFADIRVDAEQQPAGVAITLLTRERYFIGAVRVQGAPPPPSENELHSATALQLGYPYSEDDLPAVLEQLRRVLADDGYYQAQISHREERYPATQQVDLLFEVEAGERARLGAVRITGTPVFSEERLLHEAKWSRGKSYTSAMVQSSLLRLRNLYRRENYLEASLSITGRQFRPESNQVEIDLAVDAGPLVEISVTGAEMSRARLQEFLPVFQEGTLDEDLLREGERNLHDYFESQGYFQVKVTHQRRPAGAGGATIEYAVNLGPRQHLEAIEIRGNRYFQEEVIRERMWIEPARRRLPYGRFSRQRLEADADAVRALYRSNGFAAVDVRPTLEVIPESRDGILVTLLIQEGPQTIIGNFTISGNQTFSEADLLPYINADVGQPYSSTMVATDRNNLLTYYWNAGFPDARFTFQATPSGEAGSMNLDYFLNEGEPESVGHIFIGGLEHTRVGVVNRQLRIRAGEPLSQGQLLETQRRLYDLGIFSRVEMGIQNPGAEEQRRNVLLYFEEARRHTLKLGLGGEVGRFGGSRSDTTNVEGDNQFSPDVSLDVTRLNVGGRPHTASLRSRFSALQKRVVLGYTAPRLLNYEWLTGSALAIFDDTRDVRTFTARRWEGSLQFETKRTRTSTVLYRYTFRRVTVGDVNISQEDLPLQSQPVLVGLVGLSWIRDTRDVPTNARAGLFTSMDLAVAAKQFGSEASFVRGLMQNSSYHRFGPNLVLARSTQFGVETPFGKRRSVTIGGDEGEPPEQVLSTSAIPLPERFFAGGGNSHRGFGLNQAGPRDLVTGFAVGGNALLLNSLELRFPVWSNISGVLFHDLGNVYSSIRTLRLRQHQKSIDDFNYMSHGVGLGLRYNTAVAPVRFDVGYNLNPPRFLVQTKEGPVPQNLSRWQFLFSIGQTF